MVSVFRDRAWGAPQSIPIRPEMGVSEKRGPSGSFKGFLKGIYKGSIKGLGFREFPKIGDPNIVP